MREMGSAGSIYPSVCRSDGISLAVSAEAGERAAFAVRSIADTNLVVFAS